MLAIALVVMIVSICFYVIFLPQLFPASPYRFVAYRHLCGDGILDFSINNLTLMALTIATGSWWTMRLW
ncbi:hypothetical protein KCP69_12435 [Salmonella enterica subsp. enterica]|nr:hypothetical protein KCP69_12435 [Salmonella enterica subsp. enterica]